MERFLNYRSYDHDTLLFLKILFLCFPGTGSRVIYACSHHITSYTEVKYVFLGPTFWSSLPLFFSYLRSCVDFLQLCTVKNNTCWSVDFFLWIWSTPWYLNWALLGVLRNWDVFDNWDPKNRRSDGYGEFDDFFFSLRTGAAWTINYRSLGVDPYDIVADLRDSSISPYSFDNISSPHYSRNLSISSK